jgi:serine/threonine-protein kinase
VLEHWGLLWMLHAVVVLALCLITNAMQLQGVSARWPYAALWMVGLGAWALVFWDLRRRSGPVTFVERQVAHVWAASMFGSTLLFAVEWLLNEPVLKLSPVLPLLAAGVFLVKAGMLSGEFYIPAATLFATAIPMAMYPRYGLTVFGVVIALTFFIPGLKLHLQRLDRPARSGAGRSGL